MEPLFDAIAAGDAARVRELVASDPALAGARDREGVSAVMRAHYRGAHELVAVLVDAMPELDVFEAAALGAEERLDELTAREPSLVEARSADGYTPLHLAALFGHAECARVLVERGADVADVARNATRERPLHAAALGGDDGVVELLLRCGADAAAPREDGRTAVDVARDAGHEELARRLEG